MANYDEFMWWSITNDVNYHLVRKWYVMYRLPLGRKYFNSEEAHEWFLRNNDHIKLWLIYHEESYNNASNR